MKFDAKILEDLAKWFEELKEIKFSELLAGDTANTAFISVDMIEGFCSMGPLASPRVGAISDAIAQAFSAAYAAGARNLVLRDLPFFDEIKIFRKNSLSAAYCAEFNAFIAQNPHIDTFVVLGDCTDLCVYQLVSHLKLSANEANIRRRVVVPVSLVATYDAPGHEGDFYHAMFLRHMQTGLGAQVVRGFKF